MPKGYRHSKGIPSRNGIDVVPILPEHGRPRFKKGQVVKDVGSDWLGTVIHGYRTNRDQWEYSVQWQETRSGYLERHIADWPEGVLEESNVRLPLRREPAPVEVRTPRPPAGKRKKVAPEMTEAEGRALAIAVMECIEKSLSRLRRSTCRVVRSN